MEKGGSLLIIFLFRYYARQEWDRCIVLVFVLLSSRQGRKISKGLSALPLLGRSGKLRRIKTLLLSMKRKCSNCSSVFILTSQSSARWCSISHLFFSDQCDDEKETTIYWPYLCMKGLYFVWGFHCFTVTFKNKKAICMLHHYNRATKPTTDKYTTL